MGKVAVMPFCPFLIWNRSCRAQEKSYSTSKLAYWQSTAQFLIDRGSSADFAHPHVKTRRSFATISLYIPWQVNSVPSELTKVTENERLIRTSNLASNTLPFGSEPNHNFAMDGSVHACQSFSGECGKFHDIFTVWFGLVCISCVIIQKWSNKNSISSLDKIETMF